MNLQHVRGLALDLDGTIYRGNMAIPGAVEAVEQLLAAGVRIVYLSNNATQSRQEVVQRLHNLGLAATVDTVLTGTSLAASYARLHAGGQRALAIGEPGLLTELRLAGVDFVPAGEAVTDVDSFGLVIVGGDYHFSYTKLTQALHALQGDALLLATDADATFPAADGLKPGTGAILASIERVSGKTAVVAAKPSLFAATQSCAALQLSPQECLAVGDRLDSDIALGEHLGGAALLLTGVTSRSSFKDEPLANCLIYSSLHELATELISAKKVKKPLAKR